MVDMNDLGFLAHAFIFCEQLKVVDDISHSWAWTQGFKCYEQL